MSGFVDAILALLKHQKIRYLLVGGWNTAFGYGVFVGLYYLLHYRLHYLIIAVLANVLAISISYLSHKMFVFRTKGNIFREYLKFYGVYGVTTAIGFIALPFCIEILNLTPYVAPLLISGVTVTISYFGHKKFSFNSRS